MTPPPAQPKKTPDRTERTSESGLQASGIRDLLRAARGARLRLTGGSMAPAVRGGQEVEVRPVRPGDVRIGDILLYEAAWSPSGLVAHRVTGIVPGRGHGEPAAWWVRGDAGAPRPERVDPGQVLGRVEAVRRGGRWVRLTTPLRRALGRWAGHTAAVWAVLARAARGMRGMRRNPRDPGGVG